MKHTLYEFLQRANSKLDFPYQYDGYGHSHHFILNQGVVLLKTDLGLVDDLPTIKSVVLASLLHWVFVINSIESKAYTIKIANHIWQNAIISIRNISQSGDDSYVGVESNILDAFDKLLE